MGASSFKEGGGSEGGTVQLLLPVHIDHSAKVPQEVCPRRGLCTSVMMMKHHSNWWPMRLRVMRWQLYDLMYLPLVVERWMLMLGGFALSVCDAGKSDLAASMFTRSLTPDCVSVMKTPVGWGSRLLEASAIVCVECGRQVSFFIRHSQVSIFVPFPQNFSGNSTFCGQGHPS